MPAIPASVSVDSNQAEKRGAPFWWQPTMLKVTVYFFWANIGCHGNDGNGRLRLSDVHGGGDTVHTRHDDVHEYHVEMFPVGAACDARIGLGTVGLPRVSRLVLGSPG
jgi:hypothetical protein